MTTRKATTAEVRKRYTEAGHACRISKDGHVEFKHNDNGPWLEGRWIEEYRIDTETGTVHP